MTRQSNKNNPEEAKARDSVVEKQFVDAIQEGNTKVVREIAAQNKEIVNLVIDSAIPLAYALLANNLEMTKCLVECGASVRASVTGSQDGYTVFHFAASRGHLSIVEYLAPIFRDINQPNVKGSTALCLAVKGGHLPVVQHLLKYPNIKIDQKINGQTILHIAATDVRLISKNLAKSLIDSGADVNWVNNDSETPAVMLLKKLKSLEQDWGPYVDMQSFLIPQQQYIRELLQYLVSVGAEIPAKMIEAADPDTKRAIEKGQSIFEKRKSIKAEISSLFSSRMMERFGEEAQYLNPDLGINAGGFLEVKEAALATTVSRDVYNASVSATDSLEESLKTILKKHLENLQEEYKKELQAAQEECQIAKALHVQAQEEHQEEGYLAELRLVEWKTEQVLQRLIEEDPHIDDNNLTSLLNVVLGEHIAREYRLILENLSKRKEVIITTSLGLKINTESLTITKNFAQDGIDSIVLEGSKIVAVKIGKTRTPINKYEDLLPLLKNKKPGDKVILGVTGRTDIEMETEITFLSQKQFLNKVVIKSLKECATKNNIQPLRNLWTELFGNKKVSITFGPEAERPTLDLSKDCGDFLQELRGKMPENKEELDDVWLEGLEISEEDVEDILDGNNAQPPSQSQNFVEFGEEEFGLDDGGPEDLEIGESYGAKSNNKKPPPSTAPKPEKTPLKEDDGVQK